MIYSFPIWILVAITFGNAMKLPYISSNSQEHHIADLLQRISSSPRVPREPPIHPQLQSDIRVAVFVLRETQQQILSILFAQNKIQEKLAHWQTPSKSENNPEDNAVPIELRSKQINSVENQMAQLLQRISSTGSQFWMKTSRMNKPVPTNDNKDSSTLYSAIKEAASTLQETQLQISSVLSVQADIQERINYWQAELGKMVTDNPADGPTDPRQPTRTTASTQPCKNPEDVGSKSSWLSKAFECHSSLNAAFWILSGANWQWRSKNQTALQLAVNRNWLPVVELLIKRGADCNCQNRSPEQEETVLHQAIREGVDVQIVRLLMGACDVNATDNLQKQTSLHLAAQLDRPDLAEILVKEGQADLEAQDLIGYRPLHSAVKSPKMVSLLIALGVDISAVSVTGMTPLHLAVIENQVATVRILVKAGAKVGTAHDIYGHTPLYYAARHADSSGLHDYEMRDLLALYASVDEYFLDMPSE